VTVRLVRWEIARYRRTSASELFTRTVLATSTHANRLDLQKGLRKGEGKNAAAPGPWAGTGTVLSKPGFRLS
jgi:hypothetical protein